MKRSLGPEARILRLENGGASDDGLRVMFDVVTRDEKSHPFWLAEGDIESFINYVIGLSQHAAGVSGKMTAPSGPQVTKAKPIDAVALSVTPGRAPEEGFLAVHIGTFALTFSLSANLLQELHSRLGKMIVPTEPKKPH